MQSFTLSTFVSSYLFELGGTFLRYVAVAGLSFYFFWIWKNNPAQRLRIQKTFPKQQVIWNEVKWSVSTIIIFAAVGFSIFYLRQSGHSKIYEQMSQLGWPYFFLSIGILMVIHDTYFYWMHRLMHHPKLFRRIHRVHHMSNNPSPWASYSFHPIEAVLEAAFLPIVVLIVPFHFSAIAVFLMLDLAINVLGHLGFELYPTGSTRHWLGGQINSSTHHNMHHKYVNSNFGLYFNFWDRVCGTNHKDYHTTFEAVAGQANTSKKFGVTLRFFKSKLAYSHSRKSEDFLALVPKSLSRSV
jgi:Delta7-sterol 5-desaturase